MGIPRKLSDYKGSFCITECKGMTFTKFERICKDHFATDKRFCYCDVTGKICNKANCPKFNEQKESELSLEDE